MYDCWQENPDARPTFSSLRDTLKEMERNHLVSIEMDMKFELFVNGYFVMIKTQYTFAKYR